MALCRYTIEPPVRPSGLIRVIFFGEGDLSPSRGGGGFIPLQNPHPRRTPKTYKIKIASNLIVVVFDRLDRRGFDRLDRRGFDRLDRRGFDRRRSSGF